MGLIDNSDVQPATEGQYSEPPYGEQVSHTKPAIEEMIKMREYFGVDNRDKDQEKYLQYLYEWGKDVGIENTTDLLLELRRWEVKIGYPNLGETRASKLFKYLGIRNKMRQSMRQAALARKEMRLHERV